MTRIRETGSQVGLEAGERWANVAGAFAATPNQVRDERVLLIDDVHTTGATLAACAEALAQAGARQVVGLTVGRA
jgi:predicted amidophosphoribosyltransferase